MSLSTILGVICIIVGFIAALIDDKLLFDSLTWFVAAIAFFVSGLGPTVGKRGGAA